MNIYTQACSLLISVCFERFYLLVERGFKSSQEVISHGIELDMNWFELEERLSIGYLLII